MDDQPRDAVNSELPPALKQRAQRSRFELVQGLKATTEFKSEVSAWMAGDLYQASGPTSVVMRLKPNPDGSVMGWAQGPDGRIIGQARWTKATGWGSRVVSSASVLAGHAMLVEISQKLDRIEAKVDRIKQGLDDDRRQALKAAVTSVNTALACGEELGRDLLVAAELPLRTALHREMQALAREIDEAPTPSSWQRLIFDQSNETKRRLEGAQRSFLAVTTGITALAQLYLALGKDQAAWATAHELLSELSNVGLEKAWWKARQLLPAAPDDAPEMFWQRAMSNVAAMAQSALAFKEGNLPELYVVNY